MEKFINQLCCILGGGELRVIFITLRNWRLAFVGLCLWDFTV